MYATLTHAQRMERKALEAELDATRVLLASELASSYFNLVGLDRTVALQQEVVTLAEKDLRSQTYQFKEGAVDSASVEEKKASLAAEQTTLQNQLQNQAALIHQIAVLRGLEPEDQGDLPRATLEQIPVNGTVEGGFPSQLLRRRPDIRAAEMHFLGANLNASAAKRAMLPTVNGLAQLGFSSIKIGDLFSSNGLLNVLTGSVNQGLFEGGRKLAAIKSTKAKAEIAIRQYQKTILTAFQEVDDSFSKLKTDTVSLQEADAIIQANRKQKTIMDYRLREGAASPQQVIPKQVSLLKSEQQLAQTKCAVLIDRISLFKALGGGY
jgi:multidrug efflux system outer membrane protein